MPLIITDSIDYLS